LAAWTEKTFGSQFLPVILAVDVTYLDIFGPFNELDAIVGAVDNGLLSSGLFQSLFDSLEYALHAVF
jgi:hypothetical protein